MHILMVILSIVAPGTCWQFFTTMKDLTLYNAPPDTRHLHSEYRYGHCANEEKKFYLHIHIDHLEILGKIIMRGWINPPRIPTCILLRAASYEEDMFRSTSANFQFCVPRISYCHTHHRFKYYYYEWYIPKDFVGGMNWDIYMYGPEGLSWQ